ACSHPAFVRRRSLRCIFDCSATCSICSNVAGLLPSSDSIWRQHGLRLGIGREHEEADREVLQDDPGALFISSGIPYFFWTILDLCLDRPGPSSAPRDPGSGLLDGLFCRVFHAWPGSLSCFWPRLTRQRAASVADYGSFCHRFILKEDWFLWPSGWLGGS